MNKFLGTYSLIRVKHEENQNLNRTISFKIQTIIKSPPSQKRPGLHGFTKFHQTFKEEIASTLQNLFQKMEEAKTLANLFHEISYYSDTKNKDSTEKENYKSISLMNTDIKIPQQILANIIQQNIENDHDQVEFILRVYARLLQYSKKYSLPYYQHIKPY